MSKSKARIRFEEFKKQEVKLSNSEIQLIMLLREHYLTVTEVIEAARIGAEIQAESTNNRFYRTFFTKLDYIYRQLSNKSPL